MVLDFINFTLTGLAGPFQASVIALLFLALANLIGRVIRRKIQHYNSLVILETQLNEMIGIIKDNVYLLPTFKIAIKNGNIYWSLLRTIPIDRTHLSNLADIELINEVFEFFYNVRKLNDDVENLGKGYDELKKAYIEKNITVEHYAQNAIFVSEKLDLLEIFYDNLMEGLIDLMAKIRILIRRDKPLVVKIQEFFNHYSSGKISLKDFKAEKKKLSQELEESSKKSRDEINKMLKKIKA